MKVIFLHTILLASIGIQAQIPISKPASPQQSIKGKITDKEIGTVLSGASIEWIEGKRSATADSLGFFHLPLIPVGRQSIRISYIGYKTILLSNLLVESGKELILSIELEDDIPMSKEIVVKGKADKGRPLNDLAMVSGRMFSVEETRRFAAGLNDPSRIAASFAGVTQGGDGNALIVRGNAPNGLLWRLEGVDIPNPNHFARVGTSGGAISILSAQLLANSDFLTGAFPSEYGNALAGVFDIHLRKGNKDKSEHTFSLSTIGIDAATEGPINKKQGSSYLVNYRYGFLTLMQQLGFQISNAATSFQDLSFHIHLPTKKAGQFSIFGFGGLSKQNDPLAKDSITWINDPATRSGYLDAANTGATGLIHQLNIGRKTLLKTIVSLNQYTYREEDSRLDKPTGPPVFSRNNRFTEGNVVISAVLSHKFSKQFFLKFGTYTSGKSFNLQQRESVANILRDKVRSNGNTRLTNGFLQAKWDPSNRISLQAGLHTQYLSLNRHSVFEPRAGIRLMTGPGQFLSFGFGIHSQIQPLGNYFARIKIGTDTVMPNRNLEFSRARHYVLGYSVRIGENWNLRTEAYYQWLFNIPIHASRISSYSVINLDDDFAIETLANKGHGQNAGLEWTLERYWNDRFYLLSTLSLFQSTYHGSDRRWRNTRYNNNRSFTLAAGKEWPLKTKRPSAISLDLRMFYAGGVRVTPIDLALSIARNSTYSITSQLYEQQLSPIFRLDIQGEWKIQYRKHTGSFILGVQNATNRQNPVSHRYDPSSKKITYSYLLGMIPVVGLRFDY